MWLEKYNRSVFSSRDHCEFAAIVNGELAGNHSYDYYIEHADGTVSLYGRSPSIKPAKSSYVCIDRSNEKNIQSVIIYDNDTIEVYPADNCSSWGNTSVCMEHICSTSWIIYFETESGEQYFAVYCPSENPEIREFSTTNSERDKSLESLAFNVLGLAASELKQFFQPNA